MSATWKTVRVRSEGPVAVARGTMLTVRLRIEGLKVEPPEKTILWLGEMGKAGFRVAVLDSVTQGSKKGRAIVLVNGMPLLKVFFVIEVGMRARARVSVATNTCRYQTAFISYASPDKDAVLARIQGLKMGSGEA